MKIKLSVFYSLIMMGQISAMQPAAARTTSQLFKHGAKKTFSGIMTTLHWAIAAGGSWKAGIDRINLLRNENNILQQLDDAHEQTKQFIMTESSKTHANKLDGVKTTPALTKRGAPIGTLTQYIIVCPETDKEITQAVKDNNPIVLDKWTSVIQHEDTHRINNDITWKAIVDITAPFITHGSLKAFRHIVPIAKKARPFLREQLLKIPTAFGKDLLSVTALRLPFSRYQEQRADNGISNDIELLNGFKSFLIDADNAINAHINVALATNLSPRYPSFNSLSSNQKACIRWTRNFFEEHPLPTKRIQKIDQRIALLEKTRVNEQIKS